MENTFAEVMESAFDPDIELSGEERNDLASTMAMPGFRVIWKLMKASVDHFGNNLMNVPTGDNRHVLAKHRDWKVAGQFATILATLMSREKEIYLSSLPSPKPVDSAEGLDMGEVTDPGDELLVEEPY
jgi:hypothetical protein